MATEGKNDVEVSAPLMDEKNNKLTVTDDVEAGKPGAVFEKDVEVVEVKVPEKFIGLTKEELAQYQDDPFWKRLRWALFVLFWVAWIAMFVGAIIIVATSEGCPEKDLPSWWQRNVAYKIWTPSFYDSDNDGLGDLSGVADKLDSLDRLSVASVWVTPLFQSSDLLPKHMPKYMSVEDLKVVDPRLQGTGKEEAFDNLVSTLSSKDIKMIIDIPVAYLSSKSTWFTNSAADTAPFNDMFIWEGTAPNANDWTKNTQRNMFYKHAASDPEKDIKGSDYPLLNWASTNTAQQFEDVFTYWINKGVDGFHLVNVELLSDRNKRDWKEILPTVKTTLEKAHNASEHVDKEIVVMARGRGEEYNGLVKDGSVDMVVNDAFANSDTFTKAKCEPKWGCIFDVLDGFIQENGGHVNDNVTWPIWELSNEKYSRVGTTFGKELAQVLEMMALMLPGSFANFYGNELPILDADTAPQNLALMQWDDTVNAGFSDSETIQVPSPQGEDWKTNNFAAQGTGYTSRKMFNRLAGLKKTDESLMKGRLYLGKNNATIITMARIAEGKNYYAVLNMGADERTVDLNDMFAKADLPEKALEGEAQVVYMTSGANFRPRDKVDVSSVAIKGMNGVVLRL